MHQFKSGDWSPDFLARINRLANGSSSSTITTSTRAQILAVQTLLATGRPALQIDGQLYDWTKSLGAKRYWSHTDTKLANLLSTAIDRYESWANYQTFFTQLITRQPRSLLNCPTLLRELSANESLLKNSQLESWLINAALRAAKLHKRTINADTLFCKDSISNVAVVGNAPQLLQAKYGDSIDAADCVLRFNTFVIDDSLQVNTGKRTDIWCVNPGFDFKNLKTFPCRLTWLSGYFPYHRPSNYWHHLSKQLERQSDTTFLCTSHAIWCDLVSKLHAPPSAGLLCLYTLMAATCRVNAYGFSGVSKSDTFSDETQGVNSANQSHHYGDAIGDSNRHNWAAEKKLLKQLQIEALKQDDPLLIFH